MTLSDILEVAQKLTYFQWIQDFTQQSESYELREIVIWSGVAQQVIKNLFQLEAKKPSFFQIPFDSEFFE